MKTSYAMHGTVTRVWEAEQQKHISGVKEHAEFEMQSLGWYITIDKLISIFLGMEKPAFKEGDGITIKLFPRDASPAEPDPATPQIMTPAKELMA